MMAASDTYPSRTGARRGLILLSLFSTAASTLLGPTPHLLPPGAALVLVDAFPLSAGGVIAASASTPNATLVGTPIIVFAVLQSTYTALEPLLTTGDAAALGGGACVAPSSLRLELTLPEPAAAPVGAGAALPRGGVYTLLAVQCHSLDPVPVELSLVLTNPSLGDGHAHLPQSWAPLASVNTVFACAYVVLLFYGLAGCGVPPGKGRPSLTLANTVCWLGVATKLCALSLGAAFYNSYGETGVMGVTRVLADASESVAEGVLLLAMLGVGLGWGVSPTPTPSQRRRECGAHRRVRQRRVLRGDHTQPVPRVSRVPAPTDGPLVPAHNDRRAGLGGYELPVVDGGGRVVR